jgi:hypothetical protein
MRSPSDLALLAVEAYPDPKPFSTAEQFARHNHDDISQLTDEDLDRERIRASLRFAYDDHPTAWFLERRSRLDAEATRRLNQRARVRPR